MSNVLLVGLILILALIGGHLVKPVKAPEVVGYFFIGLFLGPSFSEILSRDAVTALEFFGEIALALILFSIGAIFDFDNLRKVGKQTLKLTFFIMAGTISLVFLALMIFNGNWQVGLLLAVIATEISPIATILVLREANSKGPLTDAVYNILALNNVGCLVIFGLASFIVRLFVETNPPIPITELVSKELFYFLWGIVGSVAFGILLGYILALWGRKIEESGELLILVLGMLLVSIGGSHWLGLSALITPMVLGATLINLAKESKHLFDVLGKTDPPVYAIFFVLAGAHLHLSDLLVIGASGVAYTISRIIGKIVGGYYGAKALQYPPVISKYLGMSLVPHAGVAIGLALQMKDILPNQASTISTIILGSVMVNEVVGPIITKYAMMKAGETQVEHKAAFEEL